MAVLNIVAALEVAGGVAQIRSSCCVKCAGIIGAGWEIFSVHPFSWLLRSIPTLLSSCRRKVFGFRIDFSSHHHFEYNNQEVSQQIAKRFGTREITCFSVETGSTPYWSVETFRSEEHSSLEGKLVFFVTMKTWAKTILHRLQVLEL